MNPISNWEECQTVRNWERPWGKSLAAEGECLALDAGGTAGGHGFDFLDGGHGGIAGVSGEECTVSPAEVEGGLWVASVEEAVDETGGEAITAADAIDDIEFDGFGLVGFAFHPKHGAPGVAVGGVDFAESGGDGFDVGKFAGDFFHHAEEGGGVEFGVGFDVLAFESETFLEVFFVTDEDINVFDDAIECFLGFVESTADLPEFGAVVEVEGGDSAGGFGGLHGFDDEFWGGG